MKATLYIKDLKKWVIDLDKETDELFVGILPQPKGTETFHSNGVMYCIKNKRIVGMFIEYYKTQIENDYIKNKWNTIQT